MQQQQQQQMQAAPEKFRAMETALATELIEKLDEEHRLEIDYMYKEQEMLRSELSRIVTLMQTEIAPREKMMHELLESMHKSYEMAQNHLHTGLSGHLERGNAVCADNATRKAQLVDPMVDMQRELDRIGKLLGHEAVRPDIQGWRAPGGGSPMAGARKLVTGAKPMAPMTGGTGSPMSYTGSPTGYGGSPTRYGASPTGYGGSPMNPLRTPNPSAGNTIRVGSGNFAGQGFSGQGSLV